MVGDGKLEGRAHTDSMIECDRQNASYATRVQIHLHHGNVISAGVAGTDKSNRIVQGHHRET